MASHWSPWKWFRRWPCSSPGSAGAQSSTPAYTRGSRSQWSPWCLLMATFSNQHFSCCSFEWHGASTATASDGRQEPLKSQGKATLSPNHFITSPPIPRTSLKLLTMEHLFQCRSNPPGHCNNLFPRLSELTMKPLGAFV